MADAPINTENEEWRAVPRWDGLYEVSDLGRVRSVERTRARVVRGRHQTVTYPSKLLKTPLRQGYPVVHLSDSGRTECVYVHRAVCEAFNGPSAGMHAAHNDGSRTNNQASNLRWATPKENSGDKVQHGTVFSRDKQPQAKLTSAALNEVLRQMDDGATNQDLALEHGITGTYAAQLRRQYRPHLAGYRFSHRQRDKAGRWL